MTFTSLLRTSAMIVGMLVVPSSAYAYLSPDQVFGGQSQNFDRTDASTYQAPPTAREGEASRQAVQQGAASSRAAAQQSLVPTYQEPVDSYVPAPKPSMLNNEVNYQKHMERIQEQQTTTPTIIIGNEGTIVDSHGNVLHSGAPLVTSTGPETTLVILTMVLAAACTLLYSFYRSHRPIPMEA